MKNLLIFLLTVGLLVSGYFTIRGRWRLALEGIEGKTASLRRGNLTLPINATGTVRPFRRVEVKSEASGAVIAIAKRPGDRVKSGDLLIRLQPDDEQRSVNRAKLELNIAEAKLENTKIVLEQARTIDRLNAQARVDQLQATVDFARFQKDKFDKLPPDQATEEERLQRDTSLRSQEAQLTAAKADVSKVDLVVSRAQQDVKQAQAAHETAKNNLADAEKRLAETVIAAPIDGMVSDVRVEIGEVIQGGKTTFTGGTILAYVIDVGRLIVRAEVDEADIGRVLAIAPPWARPGNDGLVMPEQPAEAARAMGPLPKITVESFRDLELEGVMERLYPASSEQFNVVTFDVDVLITGGDFRNLLPGMRAEVSFTSEHVENALLCPNEAIRQGPDGRTGVFIPKPGSPAERRETEFVPCKFGLDNGNYSEVLCDELREATTVYTQIPVPKDTNKDRQPKRK
jgi:multidrug efflux pump subunit AcrA (membrane-fusion protein)